MNMPLISIIMPVYNAECYLNQAITSLIKIIGLNFSLPQLIKGLRRQEI